MAIGRISGAMLSADLDRQGTDLKFTTDSNSLLYLDFSNFRAGINTETPTETLTVDGSFSAAGIKFNSNTISTISPNSDLTVSPTGNVQLGAVAKVKIGGGAPNYILTTDGSGNLSWSSLTSLSEQTDVTGMSIVLGTPTDASFETCAAYSKWTANTTVTDAFDSLNKVLLNIAQNTYVGNVSFTANQTSGPSPLTVTFTASITGNPNSYVWNFGDGTASTAGPVVTHTYENELGGQYTVYFQAFNSNGVCGSSLESGGVGSASDSNKVDYITLYTPVPVPEFTVNRTSLDSGSSLSFTNQSRFATSYDIDWGDTQQLAVTSNAGPGSSGTTITHTYTNASGDAIYNLKLTAVSNTAGPDPVSVNSNVQPIRVYSTHTPVFTTNTSSGNNSHSFYANGAPNIQGLAVNFTNTTITAPGTTANFANNRYRWYWGDGTTSEINIGSNAAGDTQRPIVHNYKLTNPTQIQTFTARLEIESAHSQSPFVSTLANITVYPAPTSQFTAQVVTLSDRIGDTPQTGYLFTDLNGLDRANVKYVNTSYNTNTYQYTFGDGTTTGNIAEGQPGSTTGGSIYHTFTNAAIYTQSLRATGTYSLNTNDNTLIRTNYIEIKQPPAPPAGLSTKTISLTSVGTNPLLAANAQDYTGGSAPAAGSPITRITTVNPIETTTVSNVYSSNQGTLTSLINGVAQGSVTFTTANSASTYNRLVVTSDLDAHTVSPSTYPSNFYQVFSAKTSVPNANILVGVNSIQMQHTLTGNTNQLVFVKDDLTQVPTLDAAAVTMSNIGAGGIRYISSVPYYSNNGNVEISGLSVYDWIGQTYKDTSTPFTLLAGPAEESTSGSIISNQTKTYSQLDGEFSYLYTGIPLAGTGRSSSNTYTFGSIYATINGNVAAVAKIRAKIENINGTSLTIELPRLINVYAANYTGFNEEIIPVSQTLGTNYTDNGCRILIPNAIGDTPGYDSTVNYFNLNKFTGNIENIETTDEAVVRWGQATHNQVNYAEYLPPGPNFSLRPADPQYLRIAFRRNQVQNFTITYTGKISGLWVAAPGTQIDTTSNLSGWLDATEVYAGSGIPGANVTAGGNGVDSCAYDTTNRVLIEEEVTNRSCRVTLGSETTTNSTGNQILINIKLSPGDYLSALSIG